jgi:RimJ/RimL family protein N-acetyltransferase
VIETERLILRPWRAADRAAFAALNADPEVMRHFPETLTREQTDGMIGRIQDRFAAHGFGFGAAERKSDGALVGMVGLQRVAPEIPCAPAVEVGWRLARAHWGQGYATEAARGWIDWGFATQDLPEIVAFVVPENRRSQAVMTRLVMTRDPARDFEHPALPEGHRLRPHWLFARARPEA